VRWPPIAGSQPVHPNKKVCGCCDRAHPGWQPGIGWQWP
jgi:hypothetical protein